MKQLRRAVQLCFGLVLPFLPVLASAQALLPRLERPISDSTRISLPDSRVPSGSLGDDGGELPRDTPISGITLVLKRSVSQESQLQALLAAQADPASPVYHHWLTPEIFASRFGVADADIATTEAWLRSRGFGIDAVARSRDRITFSGSAAQVDDTFGARLHRYSGHNELQFAPSTELSVPGDLAPLTAAVLHLSTFRPRPGVRVVSPSPKSDYTAAATQAHYLVPKDLATMYDLKPLYSAGYTGSCQSLAVVGQSFVNLTSGSPVLNFQGQTTQVDPPSSVLVPNSGAEAMVSGDVGESEIDLEYASGIAYNSKLFLVYTGSSPNYNVFDALATTITENIAPIVSISYSVCELLLSQNELSQWNALFEEAAAQGQTLVASAGDSGSTGCSRFTGTATLAQQQSLAVGFPADSPYVTAVGGTEMAPGTFTAGASPYWAPASTLDTVSSLQSYVPEVA